jgi:hypothetical protein
MKIDRTEFVGASSLLHQYGSGYTTTIRECSISIDLIVKALAYNKRLNIEWTPYGIGILNGGKNEIAIFEDKEERNALIKLIAHLHLQIEGNMLEMRESRHIYQQLWTCSEGHRVYLFGRLYAVCSQRPPISSILELSSYNELLDLAKLASIAQPF